jgi:hypothetical protein
MPDWPGGGGIDRSGANESGDDPDYDRWATGAARYETSATRVADEEADFDEADPEQTTWAADQRADFDEARANTSSPANGPESTEAIETVKNPVVETRGEPPDGGHVREIAELFSEHALTRMEDRGVALAQAQEALEHPIGSYWHDGMWKEGYYDTDSRVFVARALDGNITTVMTGIRQFYIDRLKEAEP